MSQHHRSLLTASIVTVATLVTVGACGSPGSRSDAIASLDELPDEVVVTSDPTSSTSTTVQSARLQECNDLGLETASYPPLHADGGVIADLRESGRVRVGVDENTRGLSFRNPQTGEFEGFEVELAHEIARRLLLDTYTADSVVLVPLVTDEKTDAVAERRVDLTISAVSMSCGRWEQVDFSAEYFTAQQMFLVRSDSDIRQRGDLDGRTVCVTRGSSSQRIMEREVPAADLLQRDARTDCLVALQLGEADAYFGHDTFLYGMLEQDPTVEVRELLDPEVTVSHYGIAVNRDHPELTQFVNWVLADIDDERWNELVSDWLMPIGIVDVVRPVPDYRRVD